ncbi:hypothetical protein U2S91_18870 [Stenotrophomonas maltophilia]|nr:hypothetical protein U2S91_18870 [Stenotrophomonas maltophilia]
MPIRAAQHGHAAARITQVSLWAAMLARHGGQLRAGYDNPRDG